METKLYIRDGRRFKYVPNMIGMYWNGLILTKEKMQDSIAMVDSIAVVIEQHYDHVTMASLNTSKNGIDWYEAKNWCRNSFDGKGRLPSNAELISLKKYITTNNIIYLWGEMYSDSLAWSLFWPNGDVDYRLKGSYDVYVRAIAVTDVPILNLI